LAPHGGLCNGHLGERTDGHQRSIVQLSASCLLGPDWSSERRRSRAPCLGHRHATWHVSRVGMRNTVCLLHLRLKNLAPRIEQFGPSPQMTQCLRLRLGGLHTERLPDPEALRRLICCTRTRHLSSKRPDVVVPLVHSFAAGAAAEQVPRPAACMGHGWPFWSRLPGPTAIRRLGRHMGLFQHTNRALLVLFVSVVLVAGQMLGEWPGEVHGRAKTTLLRCWSVVDRGCGGQGPTVWTALLHVPLFRVPSCRSEPTVAHMSRQPRRAAYESADQPSARPHRTASDSDAAPPLLPCLLSSLSSRRLQAGGGPHQQRRGGGGQGRGGCQAGRFGRRGAGAVG
jgi:hypothetical protein